MRTVPRHEFVPDKLRASAYEDGPDLEKIAATDEAAAAFVNTCNQFKGRFIEAMDDDFNTGEAIGVMFELATAINRFMDEQHLDAKENATMVPVACAAVQTLRGLAKILGVFEMDLSRKSKKANAMFTGIGNTKRIILTDTLVRDYTPEEIESVLAHELGHFYHNHIWKLVGVSTAATFVGLYMTNILLGVLLRAGGFSQMTDVAALPIFALVLSVFGLLVMPASNTYSRVFEKQADTFALETTQNPQAFISSMRKLANQNLSNPDPNPVIEFMLYSHPAISKRIKLAESFQAKIK